ncbi:MAG: hypothetical protein KBT32_11280 [Bacteroidales bacterium]|nr:hypothetical protein [Candidatus Physcocola equi]
MVKKLDAFNRAFSKRPYIALQYLCSVTLNGAPVGAYCIRPDDGCGLGNACIYFILPDAEIEVSVQDELIG